MTAHAETDLRHESLAVAVVGAIAGPEVLRSYWAHRVASGGDPADDGLADLLHAGPELEALPGWEAITEAAQRLAATGVLTVAHFREAHELNRVKLARVWQAVPGQASGDSWVQLVRLLGAEPRRRSAS